jgi:hypothetical protein
MPGTIAEDERVAGAISEPNLAESLKGMSLFWNIRRA